MNRHYSITRSWVEWVYDGEHLRPELVIETTLETRMDSDGFDQAAFDQLTESVIHELAASGAERVRVIPIGVRNA